MKTLKRITAIGLLLISVFGCACKNPTADSSVGGGSDAEENVTYIDIVEDGQSEYVIVTPAAASDCEEFAAKELSSFIEQITGVTLPVRADTGYTYDTDDKVISVGKTSILETSGIDTEATYAKLNLTGFYIKGVGDTVIIDAYEEVGVLYGVYELVEKYGGVRFVTEDYTYVPSSTDFRVAEGEQVEAPSFQLRTYLNGVFYTDKLFMARKRFGVEWGNPTPAMYGGDNSKYITANQYTHDTLLLCPPDVYMKDYPQMYNIINGVAREICLTHGITDDGHIDPSVPVSGATVVLESLKQLIKDNPEKIYFFVGQEDHYDYCICDTCMARTSLYGNKRSSILVIFMNALLEELLPWVEENYPGRNVKLATFAYHYTEEAPVTYDSATEEYTAVDPLCVPNENLFIRIAPIRANFMYNMVDDRQAAPYPDVFKGWQAITENFWVWDYTTNYADFNFIFPNIATMQENYRYYEEIGVTYCMTQANHRNVNDFQDRLKIYVASKLMWDTSLDAETLVNEFFALYFGSYAAPLKEFWDIWNIHLSEIAADESIQFFLAENNLKNVLAPTNYPIQLLEKSIALINGAIEMNAANTEISESERETMRKRLLGALVVPERMVLYNIAAYYGTSVEWEYAETYFRHVDEVGQAYLNEFTTVIQAKANYGL